MSVNPDDMAVADWLRESWRGGQRKLRGLLKERVEGSLGLLF